MTPHKKHKKKLSKKKIKESLKFYMAFADDDKKAKENYEKIFGKTKEDGQGQSDYPSKSS